jgi:hypothetical protein
VFRFHVFCSKMAPLKDCSPNPSGKVTLPVRDVALIRIRCIATAWRREEGSRARTEGGASSAAGVNEPVRYGKADGDVPFIAHEQRFGNIQICLRERSENKMSSIKGRWERARTSHGESVVNEGRRTSRVSRQRMSCGRSSLATTCARSSAARYARDEDETCIAAGGGHGRALGAAGVERT